MTRVIKFRAWDKRACAMKSYDELAEIPMIIVLGIGNRDLWEPMQFTGLTDKNGKEIYEGDVVRDCSHSDLVFTVKWDDEKAGYYMPPEFDDEYAWPMSEPDLEVIGNIYENSDLLKDHQ